MANLADIVARKTQNDQEWKAQRESERENLVAMQDAGVMEIASNPDAYARYLQTQGDNPMYSVGNVALAMAQDAEVTQFGTKERWQTMGRSVMESEKGRGVQIFARSSFGKGYTIKAVNVPDDNGTVYYCVVSNKAGEVTSEKATLTVSKLGTMTTFSDVPEGAYYTDAVAWAVEKGVTSGTSGTTFSPNADCTRAQIVTFLWRAAGSPAPKSKESAFTDVATGSYYETAVQWAVENGITSGTSATTFSPNATCTRAQTVTFLWRSQKSPADGTANSFTDVADGTYYTDAVKWAVKNGITSGTSATTFSLNADCSRAQIVTFLYRCLGK